MRTERNEIVMIKTTNLHHHPDNPRKDLGDLSELVESIKKNGIMQNLTVIPLDCIDIEADEQSEASNVALFSDFYVLIGNRRMEACLQAGLEEVPCRVISNISKKEQVGIMLEENMQRNDLTIYEQAQGFQMMLDLGETAESIAEKTGFSKSTVYHRLNIAKLDQKVLQDKENSTSFQLSIKDLTALEQIENIKTRNKVLREANSSENLIWKANSAAEQERKDKNKKVLIKLLKAEGIPECPDYEKHLYDSKYEKVKEYDLNKQYSSLKLPKDKRELMYAVWWEREIHIIKKATKKEKVLSKSEIEQKEMDKKKKQINAIRKLFIQDVKSFILDIFDGKYTLDKNENILELVWDALVQSTGYHTADQTALRSVFMDKQWYEYSNVEQEEIQQKAKKLTREQQCLACLYNAMDGTGDIVTYYCLYNDTNAQIILMGMEILSKYGFGYSNDEQREVITGSSELYKKE